MLDRDASAVFQGCECGLSGMRVRSFGVVSAVFRGCTYIRDRLCVYMLRPESIYAQMSVHL